MFIQSVQETFDELGDAWENTWYWTRHKYIHAVGATGRVKWIPNPKAAGKYRGIFENGSDTAIVRFSAATEPSAKQNLIPGMGLKILRDGMHSANLVAMNSLDGNPENNWDFFAKDFTNHIAPSYSTSAKIASAFFKYATDNIWQVGLSDWA